MIHKTRQRKTQTHKCPWIGNRMVSGACTMLRHARACHSGSLGFTRARSGSLKVSLGLARARSGMLGLHSDSLGLARSLSDFTRLAQAHSGSLGPTWAQFGLITGPHSGRMFCCVPYPVAISRIYSSNPTPCVSHYRISHFYIPNRVFYILSAVFVPLALALYSDMFFWYSPPTTHIHILYLYCHTCHTAIAPVRRHDPYPVST